MHSQIYFVFVPISFGDEISKVQKQYPCEPFKFLEPRYWMITCQKWIVFYNTEYNDCVVEQKKFVNLFCR